MWLVKGTRERQIRLLATQMSRRRGIVKLKHDSLFEIFSVGDDNALVISLRCAVVQHPISEALSVHSRVQVTGKLPGCLVRRARQI